MVGDGIVTFGTRRVAAFRNSKSVSWIGRVHFTPDSRIEGIELDPVLFEPGSPALTEDGQAHAGRLVGFLEELNDVRLALTPVISSEDVDALKRRALEKRVQRVAREQRLSTGDATTVLFEQAFPDRPTPDSLETMLGALLSREPAPTTDISRLGTHRLEALRDAVARAGIDEARLSASKLVQRDPGSRIELGILEPETKGPSKIRDTLERLGIPLRGD